MKWRNSLRSVIPWIFGAVAGAAAGILLAPQSGRRTRRQIRLAGARCWYAAGDQLQRAGDRISVPTDKGGRLLRKHQQNAA